MDAAVSNYEVLKAEYPKSAYTSMAALMMAKARLNAGQLDLAASDFEYAMENAEPAPVQDNCKGKARTAQSEPG